MFADDDDEEDEGDEEDDYRPALDPNDPKALEFFMNVWPNEKFRPLGQTPLEFCSTPAGRACFRMAMKHFDEFCRQIGFPFGANEVGKTLGL